MPEPLGPVMKQNSPFFTERRHVGERPVGFLILLPDVKKLDHPGENYNRKSGHIREFRSMADKDVERGGDIVRTIVPEGLEAVEIYRVKRYISQPKRSAPPTMMRNKEKPVSDPGFLLVPAEKGEHDGDEERVDDHGKKMAFENHVFFPRAMSKASRAMRKLSSPAPGDVGRAEFECHQLQVAEADGEDAGQQIDQAVADVGEKSEDGQRVFGLEGIDLASDHQAQPGHGQD